MKLRNKKTGEIREVSDLYFINKDKNGNLTEYGSFWSINELNEEWEDYEERKTYNFITSCGEVTHRGYSLWGNVSVYDKKRREIGNCFETKAEAKKAVEKLKAWKRLKDKGFKFTDFDLDGVIFYELTNDDKGDNAFMSDEALDDMFTIFGDKE